MLQSTKIFIGAAVALGIYSFYKNKKDATTAAAVKTDTSSSGGGGGSAAPSGGQGYSILNGDPLGITKGDGVASGIGTGSVNPISTTTLPPSPPSPTTPITLVSTPVTGGGGSSNIPSLAPPSINVNTYLPTPTSNPRLNVRFIGDNYISPNKFDFISQESNFN